MADRRGKSGSSDGFFFFFFLGTKSNCRCDCNHEIKRHLLLAYSLEGLKLKLKLQYFGHLMQRTDSMEKTLMLGKIEGRKRRGWQRMRCWMASPTWRTWVWASSGSWWWTGKLGVLQSMGLQSVRHDWATEQNLTPWKESYDKPREHIKKTSLCQERSV